MTDHSNGRIYTTREVHCGVCSEFVGGLGYTMPAAEELRLHYGWSKIRGLGWCCSDCARTFDKPATARALSARSP